MRHFAPLLLSALAPVAVADDLKAPTPGGPSPAAALVEQLGHPDFHTRQAAGKKLLALGERALSALDTGRDSSIPEVAERCHTLAAAVRQRLDTDALLAPTLVELPEGEQTLRMVFDALNTQSRYWLRIEGDQAVLSQRVKLAGGRRTFWEAVLAVCEAAKLEVMSMDAMPHSAARDRPAVIGTVWLAAATDRPSRVVAQGAVMVRVMSPTKEELTQHPPAHAPLGVRVFPEPKLKLQRLTGVDLTRATDPAGTAIGPGLPQPLQNRLRERLMARGSIEILSAENLAISTLVLSAESNSLTTVADLTGQVRFTAWKAPGELVAVRLKDGDKQGTADGPHGTRLTVKVVGTVANEPGSTILEVVHHWCADWVRVEPTGESGEGVWFENMNGRAIPVRSAARRIPTAVRVANAAGEELPVRAGTGRFDTVTDGGRSFMTMTVEYTVVPKKGTDGTPAAVTLSGSRAVEVAVPLSVKDLPLKAGTRSADQEEPIKR